MFSHPKKNTNITVHLEYISESQARLPWIKPRGFDYIDLDSVKAIVDSIKHIEQRMDILEAHEGKIKINSIKMSGELRGESITKTFNSMAAFTKFIDEDLLKTKTNELENSVYKDAMYW